MTRESFSDKRESDLFTGAGNYSPEATLIICKPTNFSCCEFSQFSHLLKICDFQNSLTMHVISSNRCETLILAY